ncbi:MAG: type IV pilus modification PilV family protein [Planctomycetota bacterium]
MTLSRPSARRERGFTLIEILVALTIFVTAIGGILALMTTALAMHRDGLAAARVSSALEGVVGQLALEVAAGEHRAESRLGAEGRLGAESSPGTESSQASWRDIPPTKNPDGLWYQVQFRVPAEGGLLAEVKLAESQKALARAQAVTVPLSHALLSRSAVLRFSRPSLR